MATDATLLLELSDILPPKNSDGREARSVTVENQSAIPTFSENAGWLQPKDQSSSGFLFCLLLVMGERTALAGTLGSERISAAVY
jgi:hypothetical protein